MRPTLDAIAVADGELTRLGAPRLGRFTAALRSGEVVVPGQVIGTLRVLRKNYDVVAPSGVSGRITAVGAPKREEIREYGAPLYEVAPVGDVPFDSAATAADGVVVGAGQRVVHAQMDGQFYVRPSPDEPAFVAVGDRVEPGATLGLVEVMKFFYPVAYEATGPATIVEVLVGDAGPVEAGDPLFLVEPAD